MTTTIVQIEMASASEWISRVKDSFSASLVGVSEMDPNVLSILGMSGRCYRHFINNLIRATPDARYLEIGSWAGSTLCSAINRNAVRATAIDNWSQFGGPKDQFQANVDRFKTPQAYVNFIENDFRMVDYSLLGTFNIYLFDGPHEYEDQYDGLMLTRTALDRQFVLVIDDWNLDRVRDGTRRAMQDAGITPVFSIEVRTSLDGSHPPAEMSGQNSDWHNGYFICVAEQEGGRNLKLATT